MLSEDLESEIVSLRQELAVARSHLAAAHEKLAKTDDGPRSGGVYVGRLLSETSSETTSAANWTNYTVAENTTAQLEGMQALIDMYASSCLQGPTNPDDLNWDASGSLFFAFQVMSESRS